MHRPAIAMQEALQIVIEGLVRHTPKRRTSRRVRRLWGVDYGPAQLAGKSVEPAA